MSQDREFVYHPSDQAPAEWLKREYSSQHVIDELKIMAQHGLLPHEDRTVLTPEQQLKRTIRYTPKSSSHS